MSVALLANASRTRLPLVLFFPLAAAVATAGMSLGGVVQALLLGQLPAYALVARAGARRHAPGAAAIGIGAVHLIAVVLGSPPFWGPSLARYERELRRAAGPGARECGVVALDQDRTAAYRCAQAALAQREPFWVAFQVMGIDSTIYEGLASRSPGEAVRLVWDSDIYGGYNLVPIRRLSKTACQAPNFRTEERPEVDCGERRDQESISSKR